MKMIVHDLKSPLTSVLATMEMLMDGDFGTLTTAAARRTRRRRRKGGGPARADRGPARGATHRGDARSRSTSTPIAPGRVAHRDRARVAASLSAGARDARPSRSRTTRRCSRPTGADQAGHRQPHSERAHALGERGARCSCRVRRDGDGVLFTVADNGPGIPPEYHEIIFRKFEQVRDAEHASRRAAPASGSRSASWWSSARRADLGAEHRGEGQLVLHELPSDPTAVDSQPVAAPAAAAWGDSGR